MIPTAHERLQELHEKMLDWICEHIKDDEDLFHALYGRIGFAQSELDPEIECRLCGVPVFLANLVRRRAYRPG